jgi:hypothetical protein
MAPPSMMPPAGRLPDMLLALAIGLAGGVAADIIGMPLPMMLGSLVALAPRGFPNGSALRSCR